MDKKLFQPQKVKLEKILEQHNIKCEVKPSHVDEEAVKKFDKQNASPEIISKNLAELKSNKISQKFPESRHWSRQWDRFRGQGYI